MFMIGAANGNQTVAARMAGYAGNARQLAVQGSVNMRNPRIQQMISEKLDEMVEPSLRALAEGLNATKRHTSVTKSGEFRYSDPEPDHRVRTATASRVLERRERVSKSYAAGFEADEDRAELQKEVAGQSNTEGRAESEKKLVVADPTDRMLVRELAEIDQQIGKLEGELTEKAKEEVDPT